MKKLEFLMIPRLIFFDKTLTDSQKLLLSALYHLLTHYNEDEVKKQPINIKLKSGVLKEIASIDNLHTLTDISKLQIKNDYNYFKSLGIIDEFNNKNKIYVAAGSNSKGFNLFDIKLKKEDGENNSGYVVLDSSIIYNDLNLTEKMLSAIYSTNHKNNKVIDYSNESLAKNLNKSERTIIRANKNLKDKGLIKIDKTANRKVVTYDKNAYIDSSINYIQNQNNIKIDKIVNNNQNAGRDINNNIQNYNIILSDKESLKLIKEIVNNSKFPELIKFISENKYLINKGGE